MMLGEVLGQARRALAVLDPALRAEIERAGESPDVFARRAVSEFERSASEEDWATLVSRLRQSRDPGADCLAAMVRWRLSGWLPARQSGAAASETASATTATSAHASPDTRTTR